MRSPAMTEALAAAWGAFGAVQTTDAPPGSLLEMPAQVRAWLTPRDFRLFFVSHVAANVAAQILRPDGLDADVQGFTVYVRSAPLALVAAAAVAAGVDDLEGFVMLPPAV